MIICCPDCGNAIGVNDRTRSVICRCKRYIRREEFEEAFGGMNPETFLPQIIVKRTDRNMREMRKVVAKIERGAQAQLDRARERGAEKKGR